MECQSAVSVVPRGQGAAERLPVDLDENVPGAQMVRDGRVEGVPLARLLLDVRQPEGLHGQTQSILVR